MQKLCNILFIIFCYIRYKIGYTKLFHGYNKSKLQGDYNIIIYKFSIEVELDIQLLLNQFNI